MTTAPTDQTQTTPQTRSLQFDLGLGVLRAATGLIFLMHGVQKVFTYGMAGTTGAFTQMGVPLPGLSAPLVSAVELIGGAALILGLFTRWAAALLALDMLVALILVHAKAGFFAPGGIEFALALFAGAVAISLIGAGKYALDALITNRLNARSA
jgi:putative oxidoreductase